MESKIKIFLLWALVSLSISVSAYFALMFLAWKSFMAILSFDFSISLPIILAYVLIAIGVISFAVFVFFIYKIIKQKLSE